MTFLRVGFLGLTRNIVRRGTSGGPEGQTEVWSNRGVFWSS